MLDLYYVYHVLIHSRTLLPNERWRGIMWDALKLQWN